MAIESLQERRKKQALQGLRLRAAAGLHRVQRQVHVPERLSRRRIPHNNLTTANRVICERIALYSDDPIGCEASLSPVGGRAISHTAEISIREQCLCRVKQGVEGVRLDEAHHEDEAVLTTFTVSGP